MKKRSFLVVSLLIISNCNAFSWNYLSSIWSAPLSKKPVTFLVFMAADNDLYPYIDDDLKEMKRIGSNKNLNILVYLNTHLPDQKKVTKKLIIRKKYITQHGSDKVKDSGDPKTVISACKWALKHFPSEQFVLVFWNHGSGSLNKNNPCWRSVCYDDTTKHYLTDQKLQAALKEVVETYGKKIDIIAFDACLMADLEIAYAIKDYADYMVASQETIPGTGYGYDYALKQIAKKPQNSYQFAKIMVHAYEREYSKIDKKYTLSAVDLSQLNKLCNNTNQIAELLTLVLNLQEYETTNRQHIKSCAKHCTCFDKKYLDMYHFYSNLLEKLDNMTMETLTKKTLSHLLEEELHLISQCVIDSVHGKEHSKSHGLSIYFDRKRLDQTYATTLWAEKSPWFSFLQRYRQLGTKEITDN